MAINIDFYEHFSACHDSDQTALIDMVMDDIEEIPTAYDVDAVCNELERMSLIILSPTKKDCFGEPCKESDCMVCILNRIAEIVRNGGRYEI